MLNRQDVPTHLIMALNSSLPISPDLSTSYMSNMSLALSRQVPEKQKCHCEQVVHQKVQVLESKRVKMNWGHLEILTFGKYDDDVEKFTE